MSKKNGLKGLVRGKHVKIRHLQKEGWSMTIGGREIPHVRAVTARFEAGNVDTVLVEFFPGGVSIDTDMAEVGLVEISTEPSRWERVVNPVRARVLPRLARGTNWARVRWRYGW